MNFVKIEFEKNEVSVLFLGSDLGIATPWQLDLWIASGVNHRYNASQPFFVSQGNR